MLAASARVPVLSKGFDTSRVTSDRALERNAHTAVRLTASTDPRQPALCPPALDAPSAIEQTCGNP
jgi:hypothetical protein